MTDFQYTEGEFLEEGQRWIFLYSRPGGTIAITVTICQLMPTREMVRVQTGNQRGSDRVTDISWTTWIELYEKDMAFLKPPDINPEKVIPKFKFK